VCEHRCTVAYADDSMTRHPEHKACRERPCKVSQLCLFLCATFSTVPRVGEGAEIRGRDSRIGTGREGVARGWGPDITVKRFTAGRKRVPPEGSDNAAIQGAKAPPAGEDSGQVEGMRPGVG